MLLEPNDTAATLEKIESSSQISKANTISVPLAPIVYEFAAPCSIEKGVNSTSHGSSFGDGNVITRCKVNPCALGAASTVKGDLDAIETDVEATVAAIDCVADDAAAIINTTMEVELAPTYENISAALN
ncbi:hypothetical protein ACH5RR_023877 [Cinchona calisaya]|uniref:Uncharacterized protein n=1 Tax=Cinchona calisaya TaxID=153742 RepID=A0ABD2ZFC0_9GENT